jgi:xylan 1,4-beta-xylosidase
MNVNLTRRASILLGLGGLAGGSFSGIAAAEAAKKDSPPCTAGKAPAWAKGIEGQRRADLGNGSYLNPVLAGDHPDPSVLKDGNTYYKVSSSFDYYPGLVIWQSDDLVNWTPLLATLNKPVGSVYAPDLVKHAGRYYIYFPAVNHADDLTKPAPYPGLPFITNYVIHADAINGPWSEPVDLKILNIDPGHIVGEDGKRYLFLASGQRIQLSDDGLATVGKPEKVYEGWPIPEAWVIEGFNLEGPKLLRRDGWFYMFSAQGGTAGPPTSHMIVVARSRSVHGPWENMPHNPLVRTASAGEAWWSRGHGTAVEGPHGDWWIVYHGYENGFRTLGRQMLLEPIEWVDGWPKALGGDLARPLRKPLPERTAAHGTPQSDDFTADRGGVRHACFLPSPDYRSKLQLLNGALLMSAQGKKPQESLLLVLDAGDRSYEVTVELALLEGASAGLLLFYNQHAFCGLSASDKQVQVYKMGAPPPFAPPEPGVGAKLYLRVRNLENTASFFISPDANAWRKICSFEVAGYNHNVFDGFLSLRPAIFAMGQGQVSLRRVSYQAENASSQPSVSEDRRPPAEPLPPSAATNRVVG